MVLLKTCRLCLGRTPVPNSLLADERSEKLYALAAIQVSPEDSLPTDCCSRCLLDLNMAYRIQQGMLKAEKTLRELPVVKEEIIKFEFTEEFPALKGEESEQDEQDFKPEKLVFPCALCSEDFSDEKSYNAHFEKTGCGNQEDPQPDVKNKKSPDIIETPEGKFKCKICNKEFTARYKAVHHVYYFHNKEQKPCPICNKIMSVGNLNKHIERHTDTEKVCHLCGKTVRNREGLRGHIFYMHNAKRYKCEHCGEVFKRKFIMKRHVQREHCESGPLQHICEVCGKNFSRTNVLRKHITAIHEKSYPFKCTYCDRAFASRFSRNTHLRQHTNETPYKCEVCGEGFKQNVSLKGHLKSKHNIEEKKVVSCEVCSKAFASKHALRVHKRLHIV